MNDQNVRARTGVPGLDDVLAGGLIRDRLYLVEGMPGSGKTTLGFQFLLEGARNGEPVLYVTLSETEAEIRDVADSHGWSMEGVHVRELVPEDSNFGAGAQYTVFHPSEVELAATTEKILSGVDALRPRRMVFDSLSNRLLAGSPLQYRRRSVAQAVFVVGAAPCCCSTT
jgi:circadian clock protein KaiC